MRGLGLGLSLGLSGGNGTAGVVPGEAILDQLLAAIEDENGFDILDGPE